MQGRGDRGRKECLTRDVRNRGERRRPTEEKGQCALAHISLAGRFREAGGSASATGRATVVFVSVGGSDHRGWLSAHSAVRRATVSFFCSIFEHGQDIPLHARLGRCALVGGRARKMALARRSEVAKARAGRHGFCRRASAVSPQERTTRRTRPSRELAASWSL